MDKLVLIDGNSLINRAFYATPLLTTKEGTPTNAVYAFVNMLTRIFLDVKPTHMLVAFDVKGPTLRHEQYADYKKGRRPMPDELAPQLPLLKEVLDAMDIPRYERQGIEADDIIGTLCKKFDDQTIIYTGDKDALQLVDKCTCVYLTRKGISEIEEFCEENFREKTGLEPSQIIDLKALMGDASDNIPGVRGVGEKTALLLLNEYKSIDGVYANIEKISGSLKGKLESGISDAYLSKNLATIDTRLNIDLNLDRLSVNFPYGAKAKNKFTSLQFTSLLKRAEAFSESAAVPEPEISKITAIRITDAENLKSALKDKTDLTIVLDKDIHFYDGKDEFHVPVREGFLDDGLDFYEALSLLSEAFKGGKRLVLHNKKDLRHKLGKMGIDFGAHAEDVSIMCYLADYTGNEETAGELIEKYGKDKTAPAYSLYLIKEDFLSRLKEEGMERLYTELELPLSDVLYGMEKSGFKIDTAMLQELTKKAENEIRQLSDSIYTLAGGEFNINSTKQLGDVLFNKLGLDRGKKTKTGYSTDKDVLEGLDGSHEIIPYILNYRIKQKLYSTYLMGLKPLIDRSTDIVHTNFHQLIAATGRLSSKDPNLQNIPIREEEGRELRKMFIPRTESGLIISADYDQIELRLLAHFSGCPHLIDSFIRGEDIHSSTASRVFNVPVDKVTPANRRDAKAVNFGIIYGISDFGLSSNLKIPVKQAAEIIKSYFESYPEVKNYMDSNVDFAKKHGYAVSLMGRRRYIKEIHSQNYNLRSAGERIAMNMPLQGSSADIIKLAMLKLSSRMEREKLKSKLILQVHDELIVDAVIEEKEIVMKLLKEEMEGAVSLSVPLTVQVSSGKNWFEA